MRKEVSEHEVIHTAGHQGRSVVELSFAVWHQHSQSGLLKAPAEWVESEKVLAQTVSGYVLFHVDQSHDL